MDLPDPSKTQSIVGKVLSVCTGSASRGQIAHFGLDQALYSILSAAFTESVCDLLRGVVVQFGTGTDVLGASDR